MSKLAVLVPTRSRPHNIKPVVEAWWRTGAFDVADLWFSYDRDDVTANEYESIILGLPEVKGMWSMDWRPLVPKLNAGAVSLVKDHEYPYVAFMGDDHIPRTQRWAHMLVENHMSSENLIWYGRDGFQDAKLPTWWSMDARAIEALGGMVPGAVQHLYCDNTVLELGKAAGRIGYDDRILVEHMHPMLGKARVDSQYERVNRHEQYRRDGQAFSVWAATGLARDATILRNIGG